MKAWSVQFQYGSIFAHSPAVENTQGARPRAIELVYGFHKVNADNFLRFKQIPYQGIVLQYTEYDTHILGQGIALFYFFAPYLRNSASFRLTLRCAAGLALLNKPFHPVTNPTNQSYSTPLSAYLGIGLEGRVRLHPYYIITAGLHYQHVSNGGIKEPNKGINWPVGALGVVYEPKWTIPFYDLNTLHRPKRWSYTISPFVGGRNVVGEQLQWKWIYGIRTEVQYRKNEMHGWTIGLEGLEDRSRRFQMNQAGFTKDPSLRLGLTGGHYFHLGHLYFAQHLGVYVFKSARILPPFYQRYTIGYALNKYLSVGAVLFAHLNVANFGSIQLDINF